MRERGAILLRGRFRCGGGEGQREQRFLFQFVRFRGARGGAGAGATFHGAQAQAAGFHELFEARKT